MAGAHGSPAAQSGADDQTAGRLEKEILNLQQVIEQAIREDGYKKHPFYPAALVICAIFTVASLAAFIAYDVVIWAVFTFVGIFVSIASAAAVKLQNKEYKEQSARLEEMIQPYRTALARKQSELEQLRTKG